MTEAERRKLYPKSFLLSASESRDINRVYNTMIQARIKEDIEKGSFETTAREACEMCGIDPQRLHRIYDRKVRLVKLWSYYISDVTFERTGKRYVRYKIITNAAPIKEVPRALEEAFYNEQDPAKKAEIIGITDALYINASDLHSLESLVRQLSQDSEEAALEIAKRKTSKALDGVFYARAGKARMTKRQDFSGTICEISIDGLRLTVPEALYRESIFSPNTIKILNQISEKALAENFSSDQIEITLKEYMTRQKLKDRKHAKQMLIEGVTDLYNISMEYSKEDKYHNYTFKGRIIQEHGITEFKRGSATKITPRFGAEYFKHMQQAPAVGLFDPDIDAIPNNKRNEYYIALYLAINARRNIGKPRQERTVSVKTLLGHTDLNYEKLKDKSQASQKIIKPFTDALDYLVDFGILHEWRMCYSGKTESERYLTDEDLEKAWTDYSLFHSLVIDYEYPAPIEAEYLKQREALEERRTNGVKALKAYNSNRKKRT